MVANRSFEVVILAIPSNAQLTLLLRLFTNHNRHATPQDSGCKTLGHSRPIENSSSISSSEPAPVECWAKAGNRCLVAARAPRAGLARPPVRLKRLGHFQPGDLALARRAPTRRGTASRGSKKQTPRPVPAIGDRHSELFTAVQPYSGESIAKRFAARLS